MWSVAGIRRWLSGSEGRQKSSRLAGRRQRQSRPLAVEALESRQLLTTIYRGAIVPGNLLNDTIPAPVSNNTYQYIYRYTPAAAVDVTLSLSSLNSTAANPRVGVYSPKFIPSSLPLAYVGPGYKSSPIHLKAGTSYEFAVNDNGLASGPYAMALEGVSPASADAVTMNRGNVKAGTISAAGEVDEYTFTAPAQSKVTLSLADTGSSTGYAPRAVLYSYTSGKVKLYSTLTGSLVTEDTAGTKVLSEVLAGGTYVVQVYDNNFTQGSSSSNYILAVEGVKSPTPSVDAVPLVLGDINYGTIVAGEVDEYTFTGSIGNVVTVSMSDITTGTRNDLWAELYSPTTGTKVHKLPGSVGNTDAVENGHKVVYKLPETGTYVIQVYDNNYTDTESYVIALEGLNPRTPDAVLLPANAPLYGTIGAVGQVDEYYFAAVPGVKTITFTSSTNVNYKPQATLYAPSGAKVVDLFTPGTGIQTVTLKEAGIYVIQVFDNDFTHTSAGLKSPFYMIKRSV